MLSPFTQDFWPCSLPLVLQLEHESYRDGLPRSWLSILSWNDSALFYHQTTLSWPQQSTIAMGVSVICIKLESWRVVEHQAGALKKRLDLKQDWKGQKRTSRQILWDSNCSKNKSYPLNQEGWIGNYIFPFPSPFPFSWCSGVLFNGYQKRVLALNVQLEIEIVQIRSIGPCTSTRTCRCHFASDFFTVLVVQGCCYSPVK